MSKFMFVIDGRGIESWYPVDEKVGASKYEDPDTTPGGASMKFFATQRLAVFGGKFIKDKINAIIQIMILK